MAAAASVLIASCSLSQAETAQADPAKKENQKRNYRNQKTGKHV